ncbi:putative arabinogalactan protein/12/13/14/21 [Helianthus anomalus]
MEAMKMMKLFTLMMVMVMAVSAITVTASDAPAPAPASDATAGFVPTAIASLSALVFAFLF